MDIVKFIVCLIAAVIVYFIVGLIAWNIVCSWIDIPSCTLVELANYKIYTYSGIAFLFALVAHCMVDDDKDTALDILLAVGFIAFIVNHWEGMWNSVALILTILYNIINIVIMGLCFYAVIKK